MKTEPHIIRSLFRAWHVLKTHPLLWIFAFFSLFVGQLGLTDLVTRFLQFGKPSLVLPTISDWFNWGTAFISYTKDASLSLGEWGWIIWMVVLFILFAVVGIYVSVSSQGALIYGVDKALHQRRNKAVDVSAAWHEGRVHFWRLFAIILLKKFILISSVSSIVIFSLSLQTGPLSGTGILMYVIFFLIAAFIAVIVSLLSVYAAGYVVIEEEHLGHAFVKSWKLFRDHWLFSLEIAAILLFVHAVFAVLSVVLVVLFLVEQSALAIVFLSTVGPLAASIVSTLLGICFAIFLAAVATAVHAYTTSVWMYLFVKMHKTGLKSRILHWAGK